MRYLILVFSGMYVLRDRLITAEIFEYVQYTDTCYFVNKRLKNWELPNQMQSYTVIFVNMITIYLLSMK